MDTADRGPTIEIVARRVDSPHDLYRLAMVLRGPDGRVVRETSLGGRPMDRWQTETRLNSLWNTISTEAGRMLDMTPVAR